MAAQTAPVKTESSRVAALTGLSAERLAELGGVREH